MRCHPLSSPSSTLTTLLTLTALPNLLLSTSAHPLGPVCVPGPAHAACIQGTSIAVGALFGATGLGTVGFLAEDRLGCAYGACKEKIGQVLGRPSTTAPVSQISMMEMGLPQNPQQPLQTRPADGAAGTGNTQRVDSGLSTGPAPLAPSAPPSPPPSPPPPAYTPTSSSTIPTPLPTHQPLQNPSRLPATALSLPPPAYSRAPPSTVTTPAAVHSAIRPSTVVAPAPAPAPVQARSRSSPPPIARGRSK